MDPLDAYMASLASDSKETATAMQFEEDDSFLLNEPSTIAATDAAPTEKTKSREYIDIVDHTTINYQSFRKNFYVEASEINRMTEDEVVDYREQLDGIKIRGKHCPKPIKRWTQCGLSQAMLDVIDHCNWKHPTPIQSQAIPAIMSGRDLIGIAKTGSGKTVAFLLPLLRHVLDQPAIRPHDGPIALIMTPTRELAMQTFAECRRFTKRIVPAQRVVCAYGGAPIKDQIADLRRGASILICTPGRLIDLLLANSGRVTNLRRVTFVVLDEADRMFDMGFGPQVVRIVNNIRPDRQTVLFSATFPASVEQLARKILNKPLEVVVGARGAVGSDVHQVISVIETNSAMDQLKSNTDAVNEKFVELLKVLGEHFEKTTNRVLIFVDRQEAADYLLTALLRRGYHCNTLHGGKDQADRDCAIADFKAGNIPILIATSVAARGLDVKGLNLVINYDCPNHKEDYVHRVGRTGRAGNRGLAITFVDAKTDAKYAYELIRSLRASGVEIPTKLQILSDQFKASVAAAGTGPSASGFGGRGLAHIDQEHARNRRTRRLLAGETELDFSDQEDDSDNQEELASTDQVVGGVSKRPNKSKENSLHYQIQTVADSISSRLQVKELPLIDPITEINHRLGLVVSATSATAASARNSEIRVIYDRTASSSSDTPLVAKGFYAEVEINDYSQTARFRVTQKENLARMMELTGAVMCSKGVWIPSGSKPLNFSDRKLYMRIDANNELAVDRALKELKRQLAEATMEASSHGALDAQRYGL